MRFSSVIYDVAVCSSHDNRLSDNQAAKVGRKLSELGLKYSRSYTYSDKPVYDQLIKILIAAGQRNCELHINPEGIHQKLLQQELNHYGLALPPDREELTKAKTIGDWYIISIYAQLLSEQFKSMITLGAYSIAKINSNDSRILIAGDLITACSDLLPLNLPIPQLGDVFSFECSVREQSSEINSVKKIV